MSVAFSLPYAFARSHGVLVTSIGDEYAELLLREDAGAEAIAEVRRQLGCAIRLQRAPRELFEARLSELYSGGEGTAAEVMADAGQDMDLSRLMTDLPAVADLLETQDEAPIIRMINALFTQALRDGASDIHVEPYERYSMVRFRRDGILHDVAQPHRGLHAAMVSRIKIMANLDIAEKRLPQDGRIGLRIAGRQVDVRVSTLPTTHGERLVLRLLDKAGGVLGLNAIGMSGETQARFAELLRQPHGILLVTGPTGSGKSTTLYAALKGMDVGHLNIVTVEDPVEYDLPGVGQIQVNSQIGLSFAKTLRSILRQDPDVIMIGEIRDLETAQIAVQASLTGHLVLATLHTNDAASAVTRLVDMGVEPFLLASTLRGVLAQRLVRCLCVECRVDRPVTQAERECLEDPGIQRLWAPVGCSVCSGTGYHGRSGIYELMIPDETLVKHIHDGADESTLRAHARRSGAPSLREDGVRYIRDGRSSLEELLRVTRD